MAESHQVQFVALYGVADTVWAHTGDGTSQALIHRALPAQLFTVVPDRPPLVPAGSDFSDDAAEPARAWPVEPSSLSTFVSTRTRCRVRMQDRVQPSL